MTELATSNARIAYEQTGTGPDIVWISGGGDVGATWHEYQIPALPGYRHTTFDNRGIGGTECDQPMPWTIADFARDTAQLIEAVCDPPVTIAGLSMGAFIVLQLAIDRPDLVRCGISMGTAARAAGWLYDYMKAEVDLRLAGGELVGLLGATHYLAFLYPASALSDPVLYPKLLEGTLEWLETGINEQSLVGQWDACCTFDCTGGLPSCQVPLHVFAFGEDLQTPAASGRQVVELAGNAQLHEFAGLGHCSLYGHAEDVVNAELQRVLAQYD
jgi:pimeloyl-ACP methyl ester carboxylesterase